MCEVTRQVLAFSRPQSNLELSRVLAILPTFTKRTPAGQVGTLKGCKTWDRPGILAKRRDQVLPSHDGEDQGQAGRQTQFGMPTSLLQISKEAVSKWVISKGTAKKSQENGRGGINIMANVQRLSHPLKKIRDKAGGQTVLEAKRLQAGNVGVSCHRRGGNHNLV